MRLSGVGVGGGGVGVRQARGPLTLSSRLPLATDLMLCLGIPDLLQHVVGSIDNTPGIGTSPASPATNPSDNPNQITSQACPPAPGL